MRFPYRFVLLVVVAIRMRVRAEGGEPVAPVRIQVEEISTPAAPRARDPGLSTAADGSVWMAWWEPARGGALALRCAGFDATAGRWSKARTVTVGPETGFDTSHPPVLAVGAPGRLVAAWQSAAGPAQGPQVWVSLSDDGGIAWTNPARLSNESDRVSLPSLASLADGRVLAVWVDARSGAPSTSPGQLYVRFVTGPQSSAPDWLLAKTVSAGCAPELLPLLDGGALLAYRTQTPDGLQDAKIERLHGHNWQGLHSLNSDEWKPPSGPDDGPQIAADGSRVAALWFTAARGVPQVLASTSPDAGGRFLLATRIDGGRPIGRPGVALLHDGAVLAVWLESSASGPGELQLRRLAPEFKLDPPTPLGPAARTATGFPQIAVVKDYAGDVMAAQVLIAFTGATASPGLHALLAIVPEGALLAAEGADCHCAPTSMQLRGYSIRGTVVAAGPGPATTWDVDSVPGVMDAGRHEFRCDEEVRPQLHPGDTFLARIERRGSDWWLFDARRLAEP